MAEMFVVAKFLRSLTDSLLIVYFYFLIINELIGGPDVSHPEVAAS